MDYFERPNVERENLDSVWDRERNEERERFDEEEEKDLIDLQEKEEEEGNFKN